MRVFLDLILVSGLCLLAHFAFGFFMRVIEVLKHRSAQLDFPGSEE
jgi:hypothetical protein